MKKSRMPKYKVVQIVNEKIVETIFNAEEFEIDSDGIVTFSINGEMIAAFKDWHRVLTLSKIRTEESDEETEN